jgi:hypothetical protein
MKARENRAPGRVVRIDLGDGRCAYGRQLQGPSVEFYDCAGTTGEAVDLLDVVGSPVAFTIWVMDYAFRRRGGWQLLDVVPLTDRERAAADRRAKQDPISKALSIYQEDPVAGTFSEFPATAQECAGLEVAAAWDPEMLDGWTILFQRGLSGAFDWYRSNAELAERFDMAASDGELCFIAAVPAGNRPAVVVAQRFSPAEGGFDPGVAFVRETRLLLVGAGTRLLAYDVECPARLLEDVADIGFWLWAVYPKAVLMAAEVEFAA